MTVFKDRRNLCPDMPVTGICRYVCYEMNGFFFAVFINHFIKIHRIVLHKIADLLYFWEIYDVKLWQRLAITVKMCHIEN